MKPIRQQKNYSQDTISEAKKLFADGDTPYRIEKKLGLSKGTVYYWIEKNFELVSSNRRIHEFSENGDIIFDPSEFFSSEEVKKAYSYIFAVYLCDGYIIEVKRKPGIFKMLFFNDIKYPVNSNCWKDSLQLLVPNNTVNITKPTKRNIWLICAYSKLFSKMFPQYGVGKKHTRVLGLQDWQKQIITDYPREFIKGCIESDGSIYTQTIGKYKYTKYNLTNKSEEIIDMFLYCLGKVGIEKKKYFRTARDLFTIQNFNKEQTEIMKSIITSKQ
jgi:hypothetical protein